MTTLFGRPTLPNWRHTSLDQSVSIPVGVKSMKPKDAHMPRWLHRPSVVTFPPIPNWKKKTKTKRKSSFAVIWLASRVSLATTLNLHRKTNGKWKAVFGLVIVLSAYCCLLRNGYYDENLQSKVMTRCEILCWCFWSARQLHGPAITTRQVQTKAWRWQFNIPVV